MKTFYEIIENALNEFSDSDVLDIWNNYCSANNYYEDEILYISMLDEMCQGMSPLEIIDKYGQMDITCTYYKDGIYCPESFDDIWSGVEEEDLIHYIIRTDSDFGYIELRQALDEINEES